MDLKTALATVLVSPYSPPHLPIPPSRLCRLSSTLFFVIHRRLSVHLAYSFADNGLPIQHIFRWSLDAHSRSLSIATLVLYALSSALVILPKQNGAGPSALLLSAQKHEQYFRRARKQ